MVGLSVGPFVGTLVGWLAGVCWFVSLLVDWFGGWGRRIACWLVGSFGVLVGITN